MASAKETGILTVAAIRKVRGETQYLFNQKQAIFTLAASGKAGRESAELLKAARCGGALGGKATASSVAC